MKKVALTIIPALSLVAYEHLCSGSGFNASWLVAYGAFVGPTIIFWVGAIIARSQIIEVANLTLSITFIAVCLGLIITNNEQLVLPAIGVVFLLISLVMLIPSIALRIYGSRSHAKHA